MWFLSATIDFVATVFDTFPTMKVILLKVKRLKVYFLTFAIQTRLTSELSLKVENNQCEPEKGESRGEGGHLWRARSRSRRRRRWWRSSRRRKRRRRRRFWAVVGCSERSRRAGLGWGRLSLQWAAECESRCRSCSSKATGFFSFPHSSSLVSELSLQRLSQTLFFFQRALWRVSRPRMGPVWQLRSCKLKTWWAKFADHQDFTLMLLSSISYFC